MTINADIVQGAREKAEAGGFELIVHSSDTGDVDQQVSLFKNAVAEGVSKFIIDPIDLETLVPYIEEARNKSVKVVLLGYENTKGASLVSTPYAMGDVGVIDVSGGQNSPNDVVLWSLCPTQDPSAPLAQPGFGKLFTNARGFPERHGLYGNQHGEVFLIRVTGASFAAVEKYTNELKVCFDHIPTNVPDKSEEAPAVTIPAGESTDDMLKEPNAENPNENLVIEVDLLGIASPTPTTLDVDLFRQSINEFVKNQSKYSEKWLPGASEIFTEIFKGESNFLDYKMLPRVLYVTSFILDPSISKGIKHQYVQRSASVGYQTTDVGSTGGAGSVVAILCKNGSATPVTINRLGQKKVHTFTLTLGLMYDYAVLGAANGSNYRVYGQWTGGYSGVRDSSSRKC
jgi:hypothetical protein